MSLRQTVQVGPPLRYAGGHCNAAKETWKAVRPAGFTGDAPLKVAVDSTPSARLPAISIVALHLPSSSLCKFALVKLATLFLRSLATPRFLCTR